MSGKEFGLFASGAKGHALLEGLMATARPRFVVSYLQKTPSCRYSEIRDLAERSKIPFFDRASFPPAELERVEIALVAGWQFLIDGRMEKLAVFHDSLLPKYRGFSPTVAALIAGEEEIGVSVIRPVAGVDEGPILGQVRIPVTYPIKISEAYRQIGAEYVALARKVLAEPLFPKPQDDSAATYSIWRDQEDYLVHWEWSAAKICRFVDAVGFPYAGAKTTYRGKEILLRDVEPAGDLAFVERAPGKIWSVKDGKPVILCGAGLVRILRAEHPDGTTVEFRTVRERLGA